MKECVEGGPDPIEVFEEYAEGLVDTESFSHRITMSRQDNDLDRIWNGPTTSPASAASDPLAGPPPSSL